MRGNQLIEVRFSLNKRKKGRNSTCSFESIFAVTCTMKDYNKSIKKELCCRFSMFEYWKDINESLNGSKNLTIQYLIKVSCWGLLPIISLIHVENVARILKALRSWIVTGFWYLTWCDVWSLSSCDVSKCITTQFNISQMTVHCQLNLKGHKSLVIS